MTTTRGSSLPRLDPGDMRVGRQPILDRAGRAVGYEVMYHPVVSSASDDIFDDDHVPSLTVVNTFFDLGLERLVGRRLAFVNLSRPYLVEPLIPFDREHVVIQITDIGQIDAALIAAVRRLARAGYTLALDDYAFEPHLAPLLPWIGVLKVDMAAVSPVEIAQHLSAHSRRGVTFLAKNVDSPEVHLQAKALGFGWFQGYHFARPHLVSGQRVPNDRRHTLHLLSRLNDPDVTIDDVIDVIASDPGLATRVLRYVNSAAVGLRNRVDSIRAAVIFVGLDRIRTWSTLLAMSGLRGKTAELINTALVRAHLCEALAEDDLSVSSTAAYTVGLLSILDALMDMPMEGVLAQLPLPDHLSAALGRREGRLGELLTCALAIETGNWQECEVVDVDPAALVEAYLTSTEQAFLGLARAA